MREARLDEPSEAPRAQVGRSEHSTQVAQLAHRQQVDGGQSGDANGLVVLTVRQSLHSTRVTLNADL